MPRDNTPALEMSASLPKFFFCCVHYSVTDSTVLPSSKIKAYQNGVCVCENAELFVLIPENNVSDAHIK